MYVLVTNNLLVFQSYQDKIKVDFLEKGTYLDVLIRVLSLIHISLCGVESQGMILAAGDDEGNLSVLTVDKDMISGSEIR